MIADATTIFDVVGRGPVHPFPARMAPSIALKTVSAAKNPLRVLDPMMGSGTVLAVARAEGHYAIGVDVDPLAVLISRVWTTSIDRDAALRTAAQVLKRAKLRFKDISVRDAYPRHADRQTREFVRYWFDGYSRRQLWALAESIYRIRSRQIRDVMWCAFSRLIISKQAGASLAMDLSHSRPHKAFDLAPVKPFAKFLDAVERVIDSSISVKTQARGPATKIRKADARKLPIASATIDLVLTSPPYLNAIDYIRCSKFSLVWMGHSISKLAALRGGSVGTEIGGGNKYLENSEIRNMIDALDLKPRLKPRQKAILARYIYDMKQAMSEIARVLVPNGKAVFVVGENTLRGTYIRTAAALKAIAKLVGLKFAGRKVRILPSNRRYLPPPKKRRGDRINLRMRREIVITFRKAKTKGSHLSKRKMSASCA
jgi:DNA modification methylase